MHRLIELIKRFQSDERGAFLALFGILAVVLIAMSGAVVDFVSVEQARTRAQLALDSAVLALQPTIYAANAATTITTQARDLLIEQINDASIASSIDSVAIDTDEGTLEIKARLVVPLNFVALVGVPQMTATLVSTASRKKLALEVAMVLDNSYSMLAHDRIGKLREATTCAVNVLFNGDCASTATTAATTNVSIGIIPFTLFVNVGTTNKNASWLDRTGVASSHVARSGTQSPNITNDNFDRDDYDGNTYNGTVSLPTDRVALMDQLTNSDWGGCVEARKYPYDTNDAVPVSGSDTMFTPMFAPDEPDSGPFWNDYLEDEPTWCPAAPIWVWTQTKYSCNKSVQTGNAVTDAANYNSANCNGAADSNIYSQTVQGVTSTSSATSAPTSLYNNTPGYLTSTVYIDVSGSGGNRTIRRTRTYTYPYSSRELQERICKYTGAAVSGASQSNARGPNVDCPFNPITPLSTSKATVMAGVDALEAQGGTNIHSGAEWGFRVLSPTAPFTEADDYGTATSKVMILMTDGENTANGWSGNMNNTVTYAHYGFPWNARLGTSSSTDDALETEMNSRLVATCNNAKTAGIVIYVIGLSVHETANADTNTQMLKDCSSGAGYWFFPDDNDDLSAVFETIADQLAALRLTR